MMGVVYEATDPALGRTIALKAIDLAFALAPEEHEGFEKRFLTEARIAARLSHPNIVIIHDVGRDEPSRTLFMALEYLNGRTLADVIRHGPRLDWREALRITARLAEALDHAHGEGVIHRDIKPGNIMLPPTGQPKLMDFGIAKMESARVQITMAGQSLGTPLYMSPEQALGEPVDRRSDIFSLGSVAYSLLAGRPAFGAESVPTVVTLVAQGCPPPLRQFAPGLPPQVERVIARAMARNPSERYTGGKRMAEEIDGLLDLDRLLEGHTPPCVDPFHETRHAHAAIPGSSTEPYPPARPAPAMSTMTLRPPRPRRALAWGVGLLVTGLALSLGFLAPNRGSSSEIEPPPAGAGVALEPALAPPAPVRRDAPAPSARLSVRLDHPIKEGLARIRVDGELAAEARLDSDATRTIGAFRFRRGGMREFLELPPGNHDVEVQLLWDGKEKTGRIVGHFDARSTKRLHAKVGGLFKRVSMEWD